MQRPSAFVTLQHRVQADPNVSGTTPYPLASDSQTSAPPAIVGA
jgi:hypothetical protein